MQIRVHGLFCILGLCMLISCASSLTAQVTTAEIVGTVTDASGAIVPGAQVTLKNLGTGIVRSMATNASGNYAFTLLPIATYSLNIEMSGFKKYSVAEITVAAGDRARIDAKLELGRIEQTVEVRAEAAAALQTDTATIGGLVTPKAIEDLPMNGRNFVQLVQLSAGLNEGSLSSLSGGQRPDDRRQTSSISANGQTDSQNNTMVDGMDNNERNMGTIIVKPSVDALAQVKVVTNMYSADMGRTGGAVVNMITKSGTNAFHGTVFEFLRNDLFDAKNFFNVKTAGNPWAGNKPKFRQNQFGFSFGGPIFKDKTFFFGDYEGLRIVQGITGQTIVPTACQLGKAACNGVTQLGNFSDLLPNTVIYDITQSTPTSFTNNIIPLNRLNSISKNYAALYPVVSSGCGTNCNFVNSPVRTQVADTFDVRIDHNFSTKDTLFGRYSFNNTNSFIPGLFPEVSVAGVTVLPGGNSGSVGLGVDGFPSTAHQRSQNGGIAYSHVFGPALLLQTRLSITRYVSDSEGLNYGQNVNTAFGGPNVNVTPGSTGLAQVTFSNGGYGGVGDASFMPTQYWTTTGQFAGDLSWMKGAHNLKFGGNLVRRLWNQYQSSSARGVFSFSSQQTNSTAGGAGGIGGNSFASLLLGYPASQTRSYAMVAPQYRAWDVGMYAQDDWRIARSLTVNLGVRYDIFTRMVEKHDHISSFDPLVPSTLAGGQVLVAGQSGVSRTVNIPTEYTNFQPRLGIAWTMGKGFVLRGGFGTSYFPAGMGSPSNMKSFPFTSSYSLPTTLGVTGPNQKQFGDPLPSLSEGSICLVAACGATTRGISVPSNTGTTVRNGLSYQYNVTIEKEFAGNILTVSYVGVSTRNLNRSANENAVLPPLSAGGCGVTTTVNLPNPCQPYYAQLPLVSTISVMRSNGMSEYHGLQSRFERRFSKGLSVSANYTFARSLANVAGPEGGFTGQNVVPQWFDWYDYGNNYFDIRHRFAMTANYELPFGKSLHGFAGQIVKNWQINGIFLYSTGLPFTVVNSSGARQNTGVSTDRPNLLASRANFEPSINEWFDTTMFALQTFGMAGNEGANKFYGPDQKRLDLSVFKTFPIHEDIRLQFRFETFNFTNSPSFAPPTATISGWSSSDPATARPTQAGNFGKITRTGTFYTPRDIQFALKLLF